MHFEKRNKRLIIFHEFGDAPEACISGRFVARNDKNSSASSFFPPLHDWKSLIRVSSPLQRHNPIQRHNVFWKASLHDGKWCDILTHACTYRTCSLQCKLCHWFSFMTEKQMQIQSIKTTGSTTTTVTIMKSLWKQVTLRAFLLLGLVAAAMEKGGGDIGSSDRVSHLDCGNVNVIGSQNQVMNHQPQFMDAIKYFFGLDKDVKMAADNDCIDLKTKGVDSLPHHLGNIFKHPPFSLIQSVGSGQPPPSMDLKEEVPVLGGKKVLKHYWPLPDDDSTPLLTKAAPFPIPTPFETQVLIGFIGNPYDLADQEKIILENAFLDTYMILNECDDITITSVSFIDGLGGSDSTSSQ